jgi:cytoskeletal protein RodZ
VTPPPRRPIFISKKEKRIMFKKLSILMALVAVLGIVGFAQAQTAPYTDKATIAAASLTSTWSSPAATYGPLLSLQGVTLASGATFAVSHLVSYGTDSFITNAVETAASGTALNVYPQGYISPQNVCTNTTTGTVITTTPVKPVWLAPGDKLLFTVSATNMVPSYIVIRAGFPGR